MRRGIVGIALLVTLAWATPVGAATPAAAVRPHSHLTNGEVVGVRWHGFNVFKAKDGLAILECTPFWMDGGSQCDQTHAVHFIAPIPRRGFHYLTVATGEINTDGHAFCGTSSADNNCVVVVAGIDKHGDFVPSDTVAVPISFKVSG